MHPTPPLLDVQGLGKVYPQGYELYASSFAFVPGATCAFLGANGAGKSTLFGLLAAHTHATTGTISLGGTRIFPEQFAAKRRIGYLPQNLQLPPWITGLELLRYAASLYGLPHALSRVETMIDYWDCRAFSSLALNACSHGMQKRIALALAFLHDPQLAILDEPFSGLDLFHTKALEQEISRRKNAGKLTIISTHIIPYVVNLCDWVGVLKGGHLHPLEAWAQWSAAEKAEKIESYFFHPSS